MATPNDPRDNAPANLTREHLERAIADQRRVLVRYDDNAGQPCVTTGAVLELDGDFVVIGPSAAAAPRRIPMRRVRHVETLEQPGGAS